jgi:amidase
VLAHAIGPSANTQIFDHTHHPALSVPCGESDGLPVGLMLVGRHFEESTLYRVAELVEAAARSRA